MIPSLIFYFIWVEFKGDVVTKSKIVDLYVISLQNMMFMFIMHNEVALVLNILWKVF